tara:strand:- start:3223 stop:3411 length:189 start_codon:yes stop_codon:yes gene_type:complete
MIHPNELPLDELLKIQKDGTLTKPQRHALESQIERHKEAKAQVEATVNKAKDKPKKGKKKTV